MTSPTPSADLRPLKLAVWGAGRWGQVMMRNIASSPDLELAAVISSRSKLSDDITRGAPVFPDWRAANLRTNLDGIVLALPPDRQAAVAEEIVEAGLPLLLEKPLALDYEAALRILTAADNFGFIGLVDHLHLFAPEFQELVRQVRHRGVVRAISAISGNRGPGRDSWSVLWDWAPHDVAMMLKVVQASPVSVSATIVDCASDGTQVLENVRLVFEFADGMVTDITTGNAFYGRCREFTVSVDETTLSYVESPENQRSLVVAHGEDKQTVRVDSIAPLTAALAEFATRIRSGVGGEEDLALGAEVVRILCAANMSLRRGMAISIERVDYRATFGTVEC